MSNRTLFALFLATPHGPPTLVGFYDDGGVYTFNVSLSAATLATFTPLSDGAGHHKISTFQDLGRPASTFQVVPAVSGTGLTFEYNGSYTNHDFVSNVATWLGANAPDITINDFETAGDAFLSPNPDIVILLT